MFTIKGYCAGKCLFTEDVQEESLDDFLRAKQAQLKAGELRVGVGQMSLPATELCYDVYDASGWRADLSRSFK